jgi:hypothetical protein
MNVLTEMVDRLKKEVGMTRCLKAQEDKQRSWLGLAAVDNGNKPTEKAAEKKESTGQKWGTACLLLLHLPQSSFCRPTIPRLCVPGKPKHKRERVLFLLCTG